MQANAASVKGEYEELSCSPLPTILDGEIFRVLTQDGDKIAAQCCLCPPGKKPIRGTRLSTGNFLSHILRVHPMLKHRVEEKRRERRGMKRHFCAPPPNNPPPDAERWQHSLHFKELPIKRYTEPLVLIREDAAAICDVQMSEDSLEPHHQLEVKREPGLSLDDSKPYRQGRSAGYIHVVPMRTLTQHPIGTASDVSGPKQKITDVRTPTVDHYPSMPTTNHERDQVAATNQEPEQIAISRQGQEQIKTTNQERDQVATTNQEREQVATTGRLRGLVGQTTGEELLATLDREARLAERKATAEERLVTALERRAEAESRKAEAESKIASALERRADAEDAITAALEKRPKTEDAITAALEKRAESENAITAALKKRADAEKALTCSPENSAESEIATVSALEISAQSE